MGLPWFLLGDAEPEGEGPNGFDWAFLGGVSIIGGLSLKWVSKLILNPLGLAFPSTVVLILSKFITLLLDFFFCGFLSFRIFFWLDCREKPEEGSW